MQLALWGKIMKRLKNKKTSTIIVLVILFILLVGFAAAGHLAYKNRNSLMAVYYMYTNKVSDLEQNKQNTDEKAMNAIKEYGIENVRPLTDDETEKLTSGELTEEEALDMILGKEEDAGSASGENPSGNNEQSGNTSAGNSEKDEEIAQLIGQMYVLKAKFTNELAAIEKWVEDQYWIYTKEYGEGNVPYNIKAKIGKAAYAKALELETNCDNQVNDILSRLTVLLEETGQSTNLVTEIKAAYENEKILAKTQYMSKL